MGEGTEQSCSSLSELGFEDKTQSLSAHPSGILPEELLWKQDTQLPPVPPSEQAPEALPRNAPLAGCETWG